MAEENNWFNICELFFEILYYQTRKYNNYTLQLDVWINLFETVIESLETVIESWAVNRFLVGLKENCQVSWVWDRENNLPCCYHLTHLNLPANFFKMSGTIFILRVVGFWKKTWTYLKMSKDFQTCFFLHFLVTDSLKVCFVKPNVIASTLHWLENWGCVLLLTWAFLIWHNGLKFTDAFQESFSSCFFS